MTWLVPREDLTLGQNRAVELSPVTHRVVLGSPGSGKTMILLHRARHLADAFNVSPARYRVFVFTNALRAYIQSAVADVGIPDESVTTFDRWCWEFHEQCVGGRLPWGKRGPDFEAIRHAIHDHVTVGGKVRDLFDFVMVDEGQDLDPLAYEILASVAKHVTVFMDHKQQVYERGSTEQDVLRALRLRHRNVTLLEAYRCSSYIAKVAASFVADEGERLQFLEQVRMRNQGRRRVPGLYAAKDREDALGHLIETIRTCVDRGDRVGVLLPTKNRVFRCARDLWSAGLEVEAPAKPGMRRSDDLPAHDFTSNRPKLMAYPSVKGLTFDAVLMPFLGRSQFRKTLSEELLRRWLFVGVTRATEWAYFSGTTEGMMYGDVFADLEQRGQLAVLSDADAPPAKGRRTENACSEESDLSSLF